MDVTAKKKFLLQQVKQKIKILHGKEEQGRAKMRAALDKVSAIGRTYKVRLARKMREMERKLAHSEAACYAKIAKDLENQLVKGLKAKVKALTAVAKQAKRPVKKKRSTRKRAAKRSPAGRAKV